MITIAIRAALSLVLLYFVYQETGWATTLALFLTAVALELWTFAFKVLLEGLK